MDLDLRRSPRVPFIASAEITELETQVRLPAQTGDISRHGCYMDMVNPLPLGTSVAVRIISDSGTLDATAGRCLFRPAFRDGLGVSGSRGCQSSHPGKMAGCVRSQLICSASPIFTRHNALSS
jgi:hypothetical protein